MASHSLAGLHASGKAQPGETLRLTDAGSNRGKALATLRTASGHPVAPVHPLLSRMAGRERARYLETALGSRITFGARSEEHTSDPQYLLGKSYAVFRLKKKIISTNKTT